MKSGVTIGLIVLGAVLFLMSGVWTSIFNGRSTWTDEKARRRSEIQSRLSTIGFLQDRPATQGGPANAAMNKEAQDLIAERDALALDYAAAHDSPILVATILKWSGLSIAAIGAFGWYAVKQSR